MRMEELDPDQLAVVQALAGPVVVYAGAGAGKTRARHAQGMTQCDCAAIGIEALIIISHAKSPCASQNLRRKSFINFDLRKILDREALFVE